MEKKESQNLIKRPPIVVIMGHVDHGKTTLLDYIRKTNVVAREAGGITQAIGAYEIIHTPHESRNGAELTRTDAEKNRRESAPHLRESASKITFIDTPGHEAFSKMRAKGALAADLAVLVVGADDGVQPQTKEALRFIKEAKIPFVVAINKIDKQNADIEKAKQDLAQNEVFLEGYGGNVSWQAVSAKTGEGVNELLDLVILATELENLTYEKNGEGAGFILSSRRDAKRGVLAVGIVKNGLLETNQLIATASAKGKIKILEDFTGKNVKHLEPSAPALILGFETLPQIGEEFLSGPDALKIYKTEKETKTAPKSAGEETENQTTINLILKTGETGSLAALKNTIAKLGAALPIKIVQSSVGDIYENDVKLAASTDAIVIGFKVKTDKAAFNLAKAQKIIIMNSEIIYALEKELKEYGEKLTLKEARALEILAVFGEAKGKERVVGGRVLFGPIKNQEAFEIWRGQKLIGSGKILNLQSQKKDMAQVEAGVEAGLLAESADPIKIGDKLLFPRE